MGTNNSKSGPGSGKIGSSKNLNLSSQSPPLQNLEHLAGQYGHYLTHNLIQLNVSHNLLESLPNNLFSSIPNLEILDLTSNNLSGTLPISIVGLKHLRELFMGLNKFTSVPMNVFGLGSSLSALEIPSNELTSLPEAISQLVNLTRLDVGSNRLVELPDEIGYLTGLHFLKARGNRLVHVTPDLSKLTRLSTLDLRQNDLKSVPDEIFFEESCLEKVLLSENKLETLPDTLGLLSNLMDLDLGFNRLKQAEMINGITMLKRLTLNDNILENLPPLDQLPLLRELDLRCNQLTTLTSLISLPSLQIFQARDNLIETLPAFDGMGALEELDLTSNKITVIPESIGCCVLMQRLFLSNNRIKKLPSSLSLLIRLRTLGLNFNHLDDLSFEDKIWSSLLQLSELRIHGNIAITCLPTGLECSTRIERLYMGYCSLRYEIGEENHKDLDLFPYDRFPSLSQLAINGNPNLKELPNNIFQTASLRKLWIADCGLHELPVAITLLNKLDVLDASNNHLKSIPPEICEMRLLTELLLAHNHLESLPDKMDTMESLQILDVSFNATLTKIPDSLTETPNLKHFKAMYCGLESLPEDWMNLIALPDQPPIVSLGPPPSQEGPQIKWICIEGNPLDTFDFPFFVKHRMDNELRGLNPKPRPRQTNLESSTLAEEDSPKNSSTPNNETSTPRDSLAASDPPSTQSKKELPSLEKSSSTTSSTVTATTTATGMSSVSSSLELPLINEQTRIEPASPDSKCFYDISVAEMQGARPTMEDTVLIKEHRGLVIGNKTFHLFVVFDGHASASCAEFCASNFHTILHEELSYALQPKETSNSKMAQVFQKNSSADLKRKMSKVQSKRSTNSTPEQDYFNTAVRHGLRNTFKRTNDFIDHYEIESGCTVALALFCGNDAWFASCGDARATVCVGGKALRATVDHKANDRDERNRVQSLGGFVTENGRVMGIIAVARSLGDRQFRPYVTYTPSIKNLTITSDFQFAIIACDGLWDVLSDEAACQIVQDYHNRTGSYSGAAAMLRDTAYALGSLDNISVLTFGIKTAGSSKPVPSPSSEAIPFVMSPKRTRKHPPQSLKDSSTSKSTPNPRKDSVLKDSKDSGKEELPKSNKIRSKQSESEAGESSALPPSSSSSSDAAQSAELKKKSSKRSSKRVHNP